MLRRPRYSLHTFGLMLGEKSLKRSAVYRLAERLNFFYPLFEERVLRNEKNYLFLVKNLSRAFFFCNQTVPFAYIQRIGRENRRGSLDFYALPSQWALFKSDHVRRMASMILSSKAPEGFPKECLELIRRGRKGRKGDVVKGYELLFSYLRKKGVEFKWKKDRLGVFEIAISSGTYRFGVSGELLKKLGAILGTAAYYGLRIRDGIPRIKGVRKGEPRIVHNLSDVVKVDQGQVIIDLNAGGIGGFLSVLPEFFSAMGMKVPDRVRLIAERVKGFLRKARDNFFEMQGSKRVRILVDSTSYTLTTLEAIAWLRTFREKGEAKIIMSDEVKFGERGLRWKGRIVEEPIFNLMRSKGTFYTKENIEKVELLSQHNPIPDPRTVYVLKYLEDNKDVYWKTFGRILGFQPKMVSLERREMGKKAERDIEEIDQELREKGVEDLDVFFYKGRKRVNVFVMGVREYLLLLRSTLASKDVTLIGSVPPVRNMKGCFREVRTGFLISTN